MNATAIRWTTRLLWVFVAMLAIYVLVLLADFAWFRTQIPVGFLNANWSGEWETKRYGGLSGRLLVRLPDPLPEDEDFKAEALIYYPIYSVWRTGQFVKMDFGGRYSPKNPVSGGATTEPVRAAGLLKFKGVAGAQEVEYAAIVDDNQRRIVGGYISRTPDDHGLFWLRYY